MAIVMAMTLALAMVQMTKAKAASTATRDELFTAAHVSVEAKNDNQVEAKNQALKFAKRRALTNVINRLALDQDKLLVPDSKLVALSEAEIDLLVRDITFEKEKFGGGSYFADLTIRFRPSLVIDYFRHNQVRFSEVRGPNLTVIPFLRLGTQDLLWGDDNPWATAWQQSLTPVKDANGNPVKDDSLVRLSLTAPQGKLRQQATTTILAQALTAKGVADDVHNWLEPLLQADNSLQPEPQDGVLIAYLSLNNNGSGEVAEMVLVTDSPSWRGEPISLQFAATADLTRSQFIDRLANIAKDKIIEGWKNRSYVELTSSTTNIRTHTKLANLGGWLSLQRTLSELPGLQTWRLVALSTRDVWLDLAVKGDMQSFSVVLSRFGITLSAANQAGIDYELQRK